MLMMSNDMNPHIGAEELEDYAMDRIPEEQAGRLEEHLLICDPCRQRLGEHDSYTSAVRQAAAQLLDAPAQLDRRPWSFPRLLPTAVALACIVLAAGAALGVARRYSNSAAPSFAVSTVKPSRSRTIFRISRPRSSSSMHSMTGRDTVLSSFAVVTAFSALLYSWP